MSRIAARPLACCALALALMLAPPLVAQPLQLDDLMRMLGASTRAEARFTETRHSSALKAPLVSTGELQYTRPDRLERRVKTPRDERYVVEGDTVTVTRGEGPARTISLSSQPALAGFLDTLRATLRGDLKALERSYRVELSGDRTRWRMVLLPADTDVADLVASIRISGNGDRLVELEVIETSGDRIVTQFSRSEP